MIQVSDKRLFIEEQAELREIEVALVDGFDDAIIGLVSIRPNQDPVVAYSIKRIIENLVADGSEVDDAYEYFSHNIENAYVGPGTPIFVEDDYECAEPTKPEESKP